MPGLLFHAWVSLAEDVHDAVPILAQILAGDDIDARVGAVLLAGHISHPAALPVLDTALSDPDLRVALLAVGPLGEGKRKAAPADRPNRLRRLIDLARRVIDAEPGLEALSGAHPGTFLVRIQAAMRHAWADEPVTVLGDMIDRPEFRKYLYLPADYRPPDTAAIEPLIDRARPLPRGQSLADTRPHCFLARAALTTAQWHRWLAPQAESQAGVEWQQRRLVRSLDAEGMTSVCERLCSNPRPRVRRAGLKIVLEALETAGGERCLNLARSIVRDTARRPRQSVESDDESVLLAAIEADLARRDGVEIPSLPGPVGAAFPDLVATPRWTNPRPPGNPRGFPGSLSSRSGPRRRSGPTNSSPSATGWPELPRLHEWLTELKRVATAWNDDDDEPAARPAAGLRPLPQAVCDDQRLAAALYAAGWRDIFEPGVRWRRFPAFGVEARVALEAGLDGATRASRPLSIGAVPPIVFSEAVRDLERAAETAQVGGPS